MIKLFLLLLLFLLSLLVIFRAPTNMLWYVSIVITEFSWALMIPVLLLLFWLPDDAKLGPACKVLGIATLFFLSLPYWQALYLGQQIQKSFADAFQTAPAQNSDLPFNPLKIITGSFASRVAYRSLLYDTSHKLTLHFYPAAVSGQRPCIVVIHGGSWAAGDNLQLPELNSALAKEGYHVASINYRLAPTHQFPTPIQDVQSAISFLQQQAQALAIDTNRLVLLGRSAGGQVALSAAYMLHQPFIKGVIDFYGPADMVWGYENPTNPLVLDSRKIMENYLGGTRKAVPHQYIQSSAIETVSSKTPPTLMIYAENDPLVSPLHGSRLSAKLRAMGIPHFALNLPWATHGFDYTLNGPGGQLSTWVVKRFLETILKEE